MGLSMVHCIVKSHGGDITVHSRPGLSTEFRIYLPSADDNVINPVLNTVSYIPRGSERVLMIDDEDMVLEVMKQMTEKPGYTIKDAAFIISKINPSKQGRIIDISASGLAFTYSKNGDKPHQFDKLAIFSSDKVLVDDFSFRTISERTVQNVSANLQRLGGEFKELTPHLHDRLNSFIRQYALPDS